MAEQPLTPEQRNQVLDIIMKELKDKKHLSFQQLFMKVNKALGYEPNDHKAPGYRATDNALQILRRRGFIRWFRFGTYRLWELVPTEN
ncbi:hypothetical protein [Sinorhizobium meliloti]|uniref:hypothetical protein n=1 Tax=Rhizobium meliloti TaxID=382 RepID=UPI00129515AA|nr:hypothetical protein [Sinorhizobium meliloti]MDW9491693.1 hypothetical protein [Sinorhizobium meliloti]MQV02959.1 hypothetical protein [Sinorhizobium meliloti]